MGKKGEGVATIKSITIRNARGLNALLERPKKKIAEAIVSGLAGAISLGRGELVLMSGRIAQAVIRGNFLQQAGIEIKYLIEKGKIKDNYTETKYGFQSLAELLRFIDEEAPDEDRFLAIQAMFFAINSTDAKTGEEILNYQLFQLAKRLTSSQLLVLRISYDFFKSHLFHSPAGTSADYWLRLVASKIGHDVLTIIAQDESALMDKGLISGRLYSDRSGIMPQNARLTDLGIKFCENIEKYQAIIKDLYKSQ